MTTASGATVYMHYCMGKVVEWNIMGKEKSKCPKCGVTKNNKNCKGCCKDEHKQLKSSDHNIIQDAFQGMQISAIALLPTFKFEYNTITFSSVTEENPNSNAPPRIQDVPLFIRNCVFRI